MFNIIKPQTPHNTSQYLSKHFSSDNLSNKLKQENYEYLLLDQNQNTQKKSEDYKDEDLDLIDSFLHGGSMLGNLH